MTLKDIVNKLNPGHCDWEKKEELLPNANRPPTIYCKQLANGCPHQSKFQGLYVYKGKVGGRIYECLRKK